MDIAVAILSCAAYLAMTVLACFSFVRLRSVPETLRHLCIVVREVWALQEADAIKQNLQQLKDLQLAVNKCIEDERFEDAQRLSDMLQEQQKSLNKAIEHFNECYDDIADIKIQKLP